MVSDNQTVGKLTSVLAPDCPRGSGWTLDNISKLIECRFIPFLLLSQKTELDCLFCMLGTIGKTRTTVSARTWQCVCDVRRMLWPGER